jgi:hypothetical protein
MGQDSRLKVRDISNYLREVFEGSDIEIQDGSS